MEKEKLIPLDKPRYTGQMTLYISLIFLFVGLFWVLIAEKDWIGYIMLLLAASGLGYLAVTKYNKIIAFINEVDWKKFSYKFYYILIVLAVIVLINIIANKRFWRKDFTASRRYTLSEHTIQLLKELDKSKNNIKMMFFRSQTYLTKPVEDLLKEYKTRCSAITIEFVNPDKEPLRAKQYNIRSIGSPYQQAGLYGTLIILSSGLKESVDVIKMDYKQMGGQYQPNPVIKENLEKDISSALLQISKPKKKIYFVQGHGEVDLDDEQSTGWFATKKVIADENYIIDKIYLASLGKVPHDCSVLIIGAPRKSYVEKEYEILNDYLNEGGNILVLLEPFMKININKFLKQWGVKTSSNVVLDPSECWFYQPIIPFITEYNMHKITEGLKYASFFPSVASVEIMDELPEGVNVEAIAKTSSDSWLETDIDAKEVKFNKNTDKKGPINIFAVITKDIEENKQARMAVIGDSDFANNKYIAEYGNSDLLLNTLNWLAGKEEMIGIRSKPVDRREIQLTPVKLKFILYSCVIILPLLIIIAGVVVWLKRR